MRCIDMWIRKTISDQLEEIEIKKEQDVSDQRRVSLDT
jgi:hypothetical protein